MERSGGTKHLWLIPFRGRAQLLCNAGFILSSDSQQVLIDSENGRKVRLLEEPQASPSGPVLSESQARFVCRTTLSPRAVDDPQSRVLD
jgi:hypothetical protein